MANGDERSQCATRQLEMKEHTVPHERGEERSQSATRQREMKGVSTPREKWK